MTGKKEEEIAEEEAEIVKGRYRGLTGKAEHISHMPSDNERKDRRTEEQREVKGKARGEKEKEKGCGKEEGGKR